MAAIRLLPSAMTRNAKHTIAASKLKDVAARHKANLAAVMPKQKRDSVAPGKLKPAELDQDSGGGYNANRTFPQQ